MGWDLGYDLGVLRVGQGRAGWVCGLVSRVFGLGGLFWGKGGDGLWGREGLGQETKKTNTRIHVCFVF